MRSNADQREVKIWVKTTVEFAISVIGSGLVFPCWFVGSSVSVWAVMRHRDGEWMSMDSDTAHPCVKPFLSVVKFVFCSILLCAIDFAQQSFLNYDGGGARMDLFANDRKSQTQPDHFGDFVRVAERWS